LNRTPGHTLAVHEATRRVAADRDLLRGLVLARPPELVRASYSVAGGPLGDFCESLGDLVGHVLMWDEINLAVLTEARLSRSHWSLSPEWETTAAGERLNRSGVAAARELSVNLLMHRFDSIQRALLDEMGRYTDQAWLARAPVRLAGTTVGTIGDLAQYVMTVPGVEPYWHAAHHLRQMPTENVGSDDDRRRPDA
jgi:hypothetical protein